MILFTDTSDLSAGFWSAGLKRIPKTSNHLPQVQNKLFRLPMPPQMS